MKRNRSSQYLCRGLGETICHLLAIARCRRKLSSLHAQGFSLSSPEMTACGMELSHHSVALVKLQEEKRRAQRDAAWRGRSAAPVC